MNGKKRYTALTYTTLATWYTAYQCKPKIQIVTTIVREVIEIKKDI